MGRIGRSALLGALEEAVAGVHLTLRTELGVRAVLGILRGVQEHGGAVKGGHATTLALPSLPTVLVGLPTVLVGAPMALPVPTASRLAGNDARQLRKRGIQRTNLRLDTGRRIQQVIRTARRNKRGQVATGLREQGTVHGERRAGATSALLFLLAALPATLLAALTTGLLAALLLLTVITGHSLHRVPILLS